MHIYTHIHHIIPRHIGGSDHPSNLIELTIEDHAIAHRHLWKMYGRKEDKIAWLCLSKRIDKEDLIRQRCSLGGSKPQTNIGKMKISESSKLRAINGDYHGEEGRRKISEKSKNRKVTERAKQNMSKAQKQRFKTPISEETRKKLSLAALNQWLKKLPKN
jgi:hypothetical protein